MPFALFSHFSGRYLLDPALRVTHHFDDEHEPKTYAKQQFIFPGETIKTHKHEYPHLSVYSGGPFFVVRDGERTDYPKGVGCLVITAGVEHEVTAIERVDWFCIHATSERDPKKIDATLIAKD